MNIAGLQKMTLLDYPGKVACTVFLAGCNFRCPFCHNSGILSAASPSDISREELLRFLEKRKGLLDGVCITGGEPTLQSDLPELLADIKGLGYPIKLDTNGTRPKMLKSLAEKGLIDYVAMDIKNSPHRYSQTVGCTADLQALEESIRFLLSGAVDYELRTTVVAELHSTEEILSMGQWLASLSDSKPKRLFLQPYRDSEQVLHPGMHAPDTAALEEFVRLLEPFVQQISLRGDV
ncbi:MAG: anaerobic ribonucleoside-triphosphate reductase activating protein [Oscillospiraceae bacterium]|nr:anaerobic ribonucleoside-triphosphate reductase activating protein [Oscillospiraceae bacterium]